MKPKKLLAAVLSAVTAFVPLSSTGPDLIEDLTVYAKNGNNTQLLTGLPSGDQNVGETFPSVKITSSTFPDPNLRAVVSRDFDRNGDGTLDSDDIMYARNLKCEGMGIKSLKGIEYLVELRGIYCMDNEIESMDLSKNKQLTGIWCSDNKLTSLDFTPNPDLEWVYCYNNNLTYLNVSNNPKMSYIECNTNPLKKLDVSHNPLLEHLLCGSCELTSIDVSKNPNLQHFDAFKNKLTTLDITHNTKMKRLNIWDNPGLGSIDVSKCPGLQTYNCAHNEVTSIDLSNNPELTKLICSYNHDLTELDLSHNPKLVYLDCAVDGLSNLDLSYNSKLYFLQAFTNNFETLNIGNNPLLIQAYKEGVKKAEYQVCKGHSWTIDPGGDTATGRDNIYFLCFDDVVTLTMDPVEVTPVDNNTGKSDETNNNEEETGDFITREMAAQTLYDLAGRPSVSGLESRFTDVKHGAWYEDALIWGEKNAICLGYPDFADNVFGVGEWITRQDLALMLMRYSEFKDYKRAIDFGRSDDYIDYYDVDYYAWEAICWSATWQIMDGKGEPDAPRSEQRIDPHGKATKEDFDAMIVRLMEVNSVRSYEIPVEYELGDVDGNGRINAVDASAILKCYALTSTDQKASLGGKQLLAADVNYDGTVDSVDASNVLSYYAYASTSKEGIDSLEKYMSK